MINAIRNATIDLLFWLIARIGLRSDMHHYSARVRWDAESACYIASGLVWGEGITAYADTAHKALYEFGIVNQMCVEIEHEEGRPLPAEEAQP